MKRVVRNRLHICVLALCLANALPGRALAVEATAGDDHGRSSRPVPPKRIVSLVPALTEQLYLLGAEESIVGVTLYCQRPPQAKTKDKVGTVIDVNIEKIIELRPDLIIASPLTDDKQIRKLRDLKFRLELFTPPRDFEELCKGFVTLSRIVGKQEKAKALLKSARADLLAATQRIRDKAKRRVFVQIGADPLFTTNDDYFINDLIKYAGGINIAGDAESGIFSREEVIKRNPDIIIIVTMGIAGEKEREVWLKYDSIAAVRNRAIFFLDSDKVCSPSPVSFVETVNEMVRIFHEQQ